MSLKSNSDIVGQEQSMNKVEQSKSSFSSSSEEDVSDSSSSISSSNSSSSSDSQSSQNSQHAILQKKLSMQLGVPQKKKKKKQITKKFNVTNLNQIDLIRKKYNISSDQKIQWFLGIIQLPGIDSDDKSRTPNINISDLQVEEQLSSSPKNKNFFGNSSPHNLSSPQNLQSPIGRQQSRFKQEHDERKYSEVQKEQIQDERKNLLQEEEEVKEEDEKEGESVGSKEVENTSESDFFNQGNAGLPLGLGVITQKLIPLGVIPESAINNFSELRRQQTIFEAEKEAQLEERRFLIQERRIGNSHYQISRDVTNAQKQQFIVQYQNQSSNKTRSIDNIQKIIEKLEKIEFVFTSFSTLPDQFTSELTHHLFQELHQLQEIEIKSNADSNNTPRKLHRGHLNIQTWEDILKMRQELLFFNISLIHKEKYVKTLNRQFAKQGGINIPGISQNNQNMEENIKIFTQNIQMTAQYGNKTNTRIDNIDMDLFDDQDFTYIDEKKKKKIILFLVQKLVQFCFENSQKDNLFDKSTGIQNPQQLDINKMFSDFQEKQFKKVRTLRNRSDSFMLSRSSLSIKRQDSKDSVQSPSSPLSTFQRKQMNLAQSPVSSINIVASPLPKKKGNNSKQKYQLTQQQQEQIQNLKNIPAQNNQKQAGGPEEEKEYGLNSSRTDLLDIILVQEINIHCFLTHVIKLIHLLQSSNQNIYIKSTLSQRMTEHILYFSCSLINMNVHEFSILSNEEPLKLQKRLYNQLFQAVQNIFTEEKTIIFYVKLSNNFITSEETMQMNQLDEVDESNENKKNSYRIRLESIQQLYDHINHIIEGAEILSLFTAQQVEFLMQKWKMKVKYPRFNNYILNYIFSLRMKSHFRFILHQDLQPRSDTILEYLQNDFSHMFQSFTKQNLYYIPLPNDETQSIQIILYQEMFNKIPDYIQSKHKNMIMQAYSKELEVSKIFEDSWKTNVQRTYEETFSLFYITRSVIFNQIRYKIEKLRRKGGFLKVIQEMEKKQTDFSDEIDKTESDFLKTKETKKQLIKALQEAEQRFTELKNLEECNNYQIKTNNNFYFIKEYITKEKSIQDMIIKCQLVEAQFKTIQAHMTETALKISKINKNNWNDEVRINY